jgi:hypothetical protein
MGIEDKVVHIAQRNQKRGVKKKSVNREKHEKDKMTEDSNTHGRAEQGNCLPIFGAFSILLHVQCAPFLSFSTIYVLLTYVKTFAISIIYVKTFTFSLHAKNSIITVVTYAN